MLVTPIKPVELIAIILILGCFILISMGKDSIVAATLLSVTSFYFGLKTPTPTAC